MFSRFKPMSLLLVALAAMLLLSACGSGQSPASSANNGAPSSSAEANQAEPGEGPDTETAKEEPATRIVSTVVGDIEIPSSPKRIIVDWNIGHLLALGVTPIGVPHSLLDYGVFLRESLPDSVADIGSHQSLSLEKMMELNPDLIITWGTEHYETFSKIAPTLVFDTGQYSSAEEEITALGEYLNLQGEAAAWNRTFQERLEAARAKIKDAIPEGSTFTIVDYNWDSTVLVVGNTGNRGGKTVYELLGLTPAPKVKEDIIDKDEWAVNLSWEVLADYAGDYIIDLRAHDGTQEKVNNVWSSLPAVQNDRVYEFNIRKYFNADPISYINQAEEIADHIANGKHTQE